MNESVSIAEAKQIMGDNFIGKDELRLFKAKPLKLENVPSRVPFSKEELLIKREKYLLIYGACEFVDGTAVNIANIKKVVSEETLYPQFYNQDWYDKEEFLQKPNDEGWFLIRKEVFEDSRAVEPEKMLLLHDFPSAVRCTYAFFVAWVCKGIKLWYEDFVWCNDVDHNGDRIYVGKYHDVDGINKDGFSIHRHLALRKCYACID